MTLAFMSKGPLALLVCGGWLGCLSLLLSFCALVICVYVAFDLWRALSKAQKNLNHGNQPKGDSQPKQATGK